MRSLWVGWGTSLQVMWILHFRVQSLRGYVDEPPRMFLSLLAGGKTGALAPSALAFKQTVLLATEELDRHNHLKRTSPLSLVYWRTSKPIRYILNLVELDRISEAVDIVADAHRGVDEKKVEDEHQFLRDMERAQKKQTVGPVARFCGALRCNVLERAGCVVAQCSDLDVLHEFSRGNKFCTKDPPMRQRLDAANHNPSEEWRRIHGTTTWASPSADSHVQSMAAWAWIEHWWEGGLADRCSLQDGWAATLLSPRGIYLNFGTGRYFIVLVAKKWAALSHDLADAPPPCLDGDLVFARAPPTWQYLNKGNIADIAHHPYTVCLVRGSSVPLVFRRQHGAQYEPAIAQAFRETTAISKEHQAELWKWYGLGDAPAKGDYLGRTLFVLGAGGSSNPFLHPRFAPPARPHP